MFGTKEPAVSRSADSYANKQRHTGFIHALLEIRRGSNPARVWLNCLLHENLIEEIGNDATNEHYLLTDRGIAYIEGLKSVPLPIAKTVSVTTWEIPVS